MTKDAALKMAIDAMRQGVGLIEVESAIIACKEALEQPTNMVTVPLDVLEDMQRRLKLKQWQGLSDDEIWDIANFLGKNKEWDYPVMFAKTIEKVLREKNT
jgi:hypothetical protein